MISVLLPVYNGEKYIAAAIRSILKQSFNKFEFLIINDGSDDNTEHVIKSFDDPRIRYVFKSHSGLSDTLNYGMKLANYELIARMDADDIALPDRLLKQYNFIKSNPTYDVISSWYAVFVEHKILYVNRTCENHSDIVKKLLLFSDISHPTVLMKKNVIIKYGGYGINNLDEDAFDDYELWLRIKNEVKFYNIQEVLTFYRYRKDSISKNNLYIKKQIHYEIQEKYYSNLETSFNITNKDEQQYYKGAREYFWGNKSKARLHWNKLFFRIIKYPKAMVAYLLTFLDEMTFLKINEYRLKLRMMSFIYSVIPQGRSLMKYLNYQLNVFLKES